MRPGIKVCGLTEDANIRAVLKLNPDYLGFIFYPQSKRFVGEKQAQLKFKDYQLEAELTGIFVNQDLADISSAVEKCQLSCVQLHGQESPEYVAEVKKLLPIIRIIKAFGVDQGFKEELLAPYYEQVDYFLFDTKTVDHGGSGRKFDWDVLKATPIRKPFFISGGIAAEDAPLVQEFCRQIPQCMAVDLNSRFESSPGIKDTALLSKFFKGIEI